MSIPIQIAPKTQLHLPRESGGWRRPAAKLLCALLERFNLSRLSISVLFLFPVTPLTAAPEYVIRDLGPGYAYAINHHGIAVGDGPTFGFRHDGQTRSDVTFAVRYPDDDRIVFEVEKYTTAHGINDDGLIAGNFEASLGLVHVFKWDGSGPATAVYRSPEVSALNAAGYVLAAEFLFHPDWTVETLNGLGWAIDDQGTVVGETQTASFSMVAALRPPGGTFAPLDLSALGPIEIREKSRATAINSAGQVVGVRETIASNGYGTYILFLWSSGTVIELARSSEPLLTTAAAWGINDAGTVVGRIPVEGDVPHAFRWKNGKLEDLNSLVQPSDWVLAEARDINESGVIVGSGQVNGEWRAFRLDPLNPIDPVPPAIVTQPVGGRFGLGETTVLSVTVAGTAPFEYQWQRNLVDLDGETNAVITLASLDAGAAGEYRVKVRNVAGEAISNVAAITVLDPEVQIVLLSGLWIQGAVGGQYEVQNATPSLGTPHWTSVATVTLTNAPQLWIDLSTSTNSSPRYYRAVRIWP